MNFLRLVFQRITEPIRIIFRSPLSLFSSPQRLLGMSLPTRVAVFVFLILLIASVTTIWFKYKSLDFSDSVANSSPRLISLIVLLVVTPLIARKLVSLWLQEVLCRFPDIQDAWDAGIRALREHGITLTGAPLYLVVGPRDASEARGLMGSSELGFSVDGHPQGNPPLLWFARDDAIFLCCPGASQVSLLSGCAMKRVRANPGAADDEDEYGGTMDGAARDWMSATNDFQADESGFGGWDMENTADGDLYDVSMSGREFSSSSVQISPEEIENRQAPDIDKASLSAATERLIYVCTLLRRYRQPFCAVNGIVSYLPVRLISTSDECAAALQSATQADNRMIAGTIGMRAHVVIMIGGMEDESGFLELMKRFGPEISRKNRIGKGLPDLWCDPTEACMEAVGTYACGAFEDNIYPLFRRDHELRETANTRLYRLLCVSRLRIMDRLGRILSTAYSAEGELLDRSLPVLGCYFAATGERDDHQAFSASVFRRLMQHPSELDWYPEPRRADERYVFLRDVFLGLNVLVGIAIVVMIWNW